MYLGKNHLEIFRHLIIVTNYACIFRAIYHICILGLGEKQCLTREGIIFAVRNRWDGTKSEHDVTEGKPEISAYESYAKERLKTPEYRRILISLERLARTLALIESSWRRTSRHHALMELENALARQHEVERDAENIEDVFLRGYVYEKLDSLAAARRSLSEEVKWDVESRKNCSGIS